MRIFGSGSLSSDPPGQLDILGHDGNSLGVDGTKVGVLEYSNHVSLSGLLKGEKSLRLEAELVVVVNCNCAHKSLKWCLQQ